MSIHLRFWRVWFTGLLSLALAACSTATSVQREPADDAGCQVTTPSAISYVVGFPDVRENKNDASCWVEITYDGVAEGVMAGVGAPGKNSSLQDCQDASKVNQAKTAYVSHLFPFHTEPIQYTPSQSTMVYFSNDSVWVREKGAAAWEQRKKAD